MSLSSLKRRSDANLPAVMTPVLLVTRAETHLIMERQSSRMETTDGLRIARKSGEKQRALDVETYPAVIIGGNVHIGGNSDWQVAGESTSRQRNSFASAVMVRALFGLQVQMQTDPAAEGSPQPATHTGRSKDARREMVVPWRPKRTSLQRQPVLQDWTKGSRTPASASSTSMRVKVFMLSIGLIC